MKYALLLVLAYLLTACTLTMSIKFAERSDFAQGMAKDKEVKK